MGSGVRGWQGLGQMEPLITAGFDAGNGELIDSTVDAEAGLFEARLNMGKEPFTEGTDKREHWQCDPCRSLPPLPLRLPCPCCCACLVSPPPRLTPRVPGGSTSERPTSRPSRRAASAS